MTETRTFRTEFLPFSPPALGREEIDEVVDTLSSPWIPTGPTLPSAAVR